MKLNRLPKGKLIPLSKKEYHHYWLAFIQVRALKLESPTIYLSKPINERVRSTEKHNGLSKSK